MSFRSYFHEQLVVCTHVLKTVTPAHLGLSVCTFSLCLHESSPCAPVFSQVQRHEGYRRTENFLTVCECEYECVSVSQLCEWPRQDALHISSKPVFHSVSATFIHWQQPATTSFLAWQQSLVHNIVFLIITMLQSYCHSRSMVTVGFPYKINILLYSFAALS